MTLACGDNIFLHCNLFGAGHKVVAKGGVSATRLVVLGMKSLALFDIVS